MTAGKEIFTNDTAHRMKILSKPEMVQVVLKVRMTADSIRDDNPDFELYASRALDWWKAVMESPIAKKAGENVIAQRLIAEYRKDAFFGKMLRGDAA